MPIYEYRCGDCGHTLDALQKLSDAPLQDCPECEQQSLKRLVSAPAFRLKGGGWYETDFKSDKEKRRNLAEGAEAKSGDGGDSAASGKTDKADTAEKAGKAEKGGQGEKSDKSEKKTEKKTEKKEKTGAKDSSGSGAAAA